MNYDYVIVGAGSAGCVLANRLSADPDVKVCLIEAGPRDTSPWIRMPGGLMFLIDNKRLNWRFETAPEPHMNGRAMYWPRGRTLGGSSSINAMVYIRGHRDDYDEWATSVGPGWSYNALLPIFRDLESNEHGAGLYHGAGGELAVSDYSEETPLGSLFVAAGAAIGLPTTDDFNGEQQEGLGIFQTTTRNGRRCSSADAFLVPVLGRPNLTVLTEAQASRVLLQGRRAVGVEIIRKRQRETLNASREVILCAGAVQSPQLLLLSGVGPKAELDRHGIVQRADLPGVGANLQDHLDITVSHKTRHPAAISATPLGLIKFLGWIIQYFFTGSGRMTSNSCEAGGFTKSRPDLTRPNLQYHFFGGIVKDHGRELVWGRGYSAHVCLLRPKSRGRIRLRSADPLAAPQIEANYLSDPSDEAAMIAAIRQARQILTTPPLAQWNQGEYTPGAQYQTDEELLQAVREQGETVYHPAGTCKMGVDDMAVVDPDLRVRGVEGLRVADASIMPTLIGGNTNAISMVIGEKCARLIGSGGTAAASGI